MKLVLFTLFCSFVLAFSQSQDGSTPEVNPGGPIITLSPIEIPGGEIITLSPIENPGHDSGSGDEDSNEDGGSGKYDLSWFDWIITIIGFGPGSVIIDCTKSTVSTDTPVNTKKPIRARRSV